MYSNWIRLQTLPEQRVEQWPVIATGHLTPGETGLSEFVVTSVKSDQWLFDRPLWNKKIVHRICMLPDGEIPRIMVDMKKSQAVIEFPRHSEATTYFNARLGLCRSSPWPDGNISSDFISKPIPVDAPSPLEFPLKLFVKNDEQKSDASAPSRTGSSRATGSPLEHSTPKKPPTGWPPAWVWIAGACSLVAALAGTFYVTRTKI